MIEIDKSTKEIKKTNRRKSFHEILKINKHEHIEMWVVTVEAVKKTYRSKICNKKKI